MGFGVAYYAIMIAAAALTAHETVQQGQNQSAWASHSAKMAERDATIAKQNAEYAAGQKRRQTERLLSRQRALYGKAGVTMEGSPLIVAQETAAEGEMDALMIERGYAIEAQRYTTEGRLHAIRGAAAKRAGYWGAGTTLLTSAGKYGGK
jgi:hypothetical protein